MQNIKITYTTIDGQTEELVFGKNVTNVSDDEEEIYEQTFEENGTIWELVSKGYFIGMEFTEDSIFSDEMQEYYKEKFNIQLRTDCYILPEGENDFYELTEEQQKYTLDRELDRYFGRVTE